MPSSRATALLIFTLLLGLVAVLVSPQASQAQSNQPFFADEAPVGTDFFSEESQNSVVNNSCNADGTLPYGGVADLSDYRENNDLSFSDFNQSGNAVEITIANLSGCTLPVTIGTYEMRGNDLVNQKLHEKTQTAIPTNQIETVSAELPESGQCTTQIDVFYGSGAPQTFSDENALVDRLMATTFYQNQNDNFPENDSLSENNDGYENAVPENRFCYVGDPLPDLTASCKVNSPVASGDEAIWQATNVSGGDGTYSYSWSGDVPAGSNTETVTTSYSNPGEKTATLEVASAGQTETATCSTKVESSGGGGPAFDIAASGNLWTVANAPIPSTAAKVSLSYDPGFTGPVTLKAQNGFGIQNSQTLFRLDGGPPTETLTVPVSAFDKPVTIYTTADVQAGTFPVVISAQSSGGDNQTASVKLFAEDITEI
jgi:hypothetical protein